MKTLLRFVLVLLCHLIFHCPPSLQADPLEEWTIRSGLPTGKPLHAIIYASGNFVAVGGDAYDTRGVIVTSTDGIGWTNRTSPVAQVLRSVAFGNGLFVAVGERGAIITSSNAVDWSSSDSETTRDLFAIAYGGGQFVAVGSESTNSNSSFIGTVWRSSDGSKWAKSHSPITDLRSVVFGDGRFIAAGFVSADGTNWSHSDPPQRAPVGYGNGQFVSLAGGYSYISADGVLWREGRVFW